MLQPSNGFSSGDTRIGWMAGLGAEFALTASLTAKGEIDYRDRLYGVRLEDEFGVRRDHHTERQYRLRHGQDRRQLQFRQSALKLSQTAP
jgi:hypothetical protein